MVALLAVPYLAPSLRPLRVARAPWDRAPEPLALTNAEVAVALPALGEQALGATANVETVSNALPAEATRVDEGELARSLGSLAVEDATGHALDGYYASLAKTIAREPGAVTRVLHYGDSVITADLISGTMRRLTQARFGDAGHGFILLANPWEWYFHNDVSHSATEGWVQSRITGPLVGDGLYGLGGVSFHSSGGAASAWFSTKAKGDYGRKVSRFDVYYLEQPAGGDVNLLVPGRPAENLTTRGPKKVSRVRSVTVPDGPGQMTVRTWAGGDVRLFGVALERDVPGVVYDALGANGARMRLWDSMNTEHWREQLALRKPALIVLEYGTNESEDSDFRSDTYDAALDRVLTKVAKAADGASVLVVAPLDRAERVSGKLRTRPIILKLVEAQRKAAAAHGFAFWNTFEAMGGEGAMGRWIQAKPQLGSWDFTHPTPLGAEAIATLLFNALNAGYAAYASGHPGAPALPADGAATP